MIDQDSHAQQAAATRQQHETIARLAAERQTLDAQAAAMRQALEMLTSCSHGWHLDCPDAEPLPDEVRSALEADAGQVVLAELRAARAVVDAARDVGDEDLDETEVAERLADAIEAYDRARGGGAQ